MRLEGEEALWPPVNPHRIHGGGHKVAQCCTSWENESDRAWVQILQKTSWQMGGVCESLDICHVSNANGDGVAGIPPFNFIDSLDGSGRTALRETN